MKLNLRFIAKTNTARTQGLMYQKSLQKNEGVLFIFEKPSLGFFWNKEVSFPIDVAFFNEQGKLMNVEQLATRQEAPVYAVGPYKYVVEAPENWFENNSIPYGIHYKKIVNA